MADGDSFSVDLDNLNNIAKTDLPYITGALDGARTQLNNATSEWSTAFDGPLYHAEGISGSPSSNSFGYAEYAEALINDLITGMGKLHDNLETARTAIHGIANRYRVADGQEPYPNL